MVSDEGGDCAEEMEDGVLDTIVALVNRTIFWPIKSNTVKE